MCIGCWQEYGSPKIVNENVLKCYKILPHINPCGPLHIIVEDFNIEGEFIESCSRDKDLNEQEKELLDLFRTMTLQERASALALEIFEGDFSNSLDYE